MRNKTQNSNSFAGYFEATIWIELTAMISSLKEHCKPDLRLCDFFFTLHTVLDLLSNLQFVWLALSVR